MAVLRDAGQSLGIRIGTAAASHGGGKVLGLGSDVVEQCILETNDIGDLLAMNTQC